MVYISTVFVASVFLVPVEVAIPKPTGGYRLVTDTVKLKKACGTHEADDKYWQSKSDGPGCWGGKILEEISEAIEEYRFQR